MHSFDLIGIGSPIVDSLARIDEAHLNRIGGGKGGMEMASPETLDRWIAELQPSVLEAPGGSAGNTIVGATRLGLKSTFLGKLGNDAAADFYRDSFSRLGIDTSRFKTATLPNARCLSLITPDSQRTMRTDLGASSTLSTAETSPSDFHGCRHAHFEGYVLFNQDLMQHLLHCAKTAGCSISLDLGSYEVVKSAAAILPRLLRDYVTVVFANEDEASAYTGLKEDYSAMLGELAAACPVAIVKLGKEGALIQHKQDRVRIAPVKVNQALDTTGAGDLWAAGFLYGWLNGRSLIDCGRLGSLLGAEVVQVMGAHIPEDRWPVLQSLSHPQS